jgi:hypothetical protein
MALLARSPHLGERVMYCPSSMSFEDPAHGDKFDRLCSGLRRAASTGWRLSFRTASCG